VPDNILSLRAAHSISLAESQMTKWVLYLARVQIKRFNILTKPVGVDLMKDYKNPELYHPDRLRKMEAFWRKRRANRKSKHLISENKG
jgi:hypothetical protein